MKTPQTTTAMKKLDEKPQRESCHGDDGAGDEWPGGLPDVHDGGERPHRSADRIPPGDITNVRAGGDGG